MEPYPSYMRKAVELYKAEQSLQSWLPVGIHTHGGALIFQELESVLNVLLLSYTSCSWPLRQEQQMQFELDLWSLAQSSSIGIFLD